MCAEAPSTTPDVTNENIRNTTLGRDSIIVRSAFKLLSIDFNFRGGFAFGGAITNGLTPVIDLTLPRGEDGRLSLSGFFSSSK